MKSSGSRGAYISLFFICRILLSGGSPELLCPGRSEVGSSARLICSTDTVNTTLRYTGPKEAVVQCDLAQLFCSNTDKAYSASVLNETHSQVVIPSVQPSHGGVWTCRDDVAKAEQTCHVTVTKPPSCTISSTMDTGALVLYEATSLTVDVKGYYCSAASSFSLQVGSVTQPLSAPRDVAAITDVMLSITLNIIHAYFGDVRLVFTCGVEKKSLKCDGVSHLEGKPPSCTISSNMDTGALVLYEATSLTVNVKGYYCSAASSFSLQVGSVTQPLSAPRDVAAITDVMLNTTLNIIHAHFGDVRLVFTCGNIKKSLKCDGVSYLKENVFQPPSLLVGVGINVAVCVTMFLLYKGVVCIYRKLCPGTGCTAFIESVHVPSLPHAQTSGQDQSVEDRGDDYAALEMDGITRNMYEQLAV